MDIDRAARPDTERKLLIIKAGTLSERAPHMVERFGDQDGMFLRAGGYPPERIAVASVYADDDIEGPPDGFSGVLVTGSAAMVSMPTPWMEKTAAWLRQAVASGMPVLGVCFGHQLLAYSLGGSVGPNPNGPEAGTIPVEFDEKCGDDPLFAGLPGQARFNAHHYESVLTLPPGAEVLGRNGQERCQAVRYAPNAWGVQFHPEIDDAVMLALLEIVGDALERNGVDVEATTAAVRDTPHGPELLRRFYDMVFGEAAASAARPRP